MEGWVDTVMVGLVLTNLVLLSSSRLSTYIRTVAVQGIALSILPLVVNKAGLTVGAALIAVQTIVLKGVVFPMLLSRALRQANVRREVEPYVGYTLSLLIGIAAFAVSLWLSTRLPLPPALAGATLVVPVAFSTIFSGLFIIIGRRQALTQVIGYLALENGIYAFGLSLAHQAPLLVELGILLDVFVAVFVMGIMIFHISRQFDHIDTDRLATLKDWSRRLRAPAVVTAPEPPDREEDVDE